MGKKPVEIVDIVVEYLENNGFDGLAGCECCCTLDNIGDCECCWNCSPGYLNKCSECRKIGTRECSYGVDADEAEENTGTANFYMVLDEKCFEPRIK